MRRREVYRKKGERTCNRAIILPKKNVAFSATLSPEVRGVSNLFILSSRLIFFRPRVVFSVYIFLPYTVSTCIGVAVHFQFASSEILSVLHVWGRTSAVSNYL